MLVSELDLDERVWDLLITRFVRRVRRVELRLAFSSMIAAVSNAELRIHLAETDSLELLAAFDHLFVPRRSMGSA